MLENWEAIKKHGTEGYYDIKIFIISEKKSRIQKYQWISLSFIPWNGWYGHMDWERQTEAKGQRWETIQ